MPPNRIGLTMGMIRPTRRAAFGELVPPVDILEPDACRDYQGRVGTHGYGMFWVGGEVGETTAHRVAYVLTTAKPIDPGMTIDHDRTICHGGPCCHPPHLRQMSNEENARDNGQLDKTQCPRGHPYDEENTYVDPEGHRRCRRCARITRAERESVR